MPREYTNIRQHEKSILGLREEGLTYKEIGEQLGIAHTKIKKYFERRRLKERKLAAGIALKRKGRPPKDFIVKEEDKIAELRYILARKDAKIKALEMQNELMQDFLSRTERK